MKKFLLPMLAVAMMGVATSCTKEYYYDEHDHNNTTVYENVTMTTEYYVKANDWVTEDGLNYYYASYSNDNITEAIERSGLVVAYVYDDGNWNMMPYVYPYYSAAEDATWAENLRFDWNTGVVTFIVQDLDGGLPEGMESFPDMTFKVCVLQ